MRVGGRWSVPDRAPRFSTFGAAPACLAVVLLGACGPAHTTERVFAGQTVVGPYIAPEAYSAFAEGVYFEEHGDAAAALAAFRRAQALDEDSPAIAARIGALLCRSQPDAGLDALETSGVARDYAPAWAARGSCLYAQRKADDALEAARRAVRLDPENAEANLLVARIHRERAEPERAGAWLFGWLLRDPHASASWRSIAEEATLSGDVSLATLARTLGSSADVAAASAEPPQPDPVRPVPLATGALRQGQPALALEQARLALAANPRDADALVAAAYAAALLGDEAALLSVLQQARATQPPGATLAPLLADLIRFRIGDAAAERWFGAYERLVPVNGTR